MSAKEELHQLIDKLPEGELQAAQRFLEYLCNREGYGLLRALHEAPEDDEPEAPEEAAAVRKAREQLARGEVISDEELWKRLGHEPAR